MPRGERLRAAVDRLESNEGGARVAVLVFDDGQQLVVPEGMLPAGVGANEVVIVTLRVDPEETARRAEEIARLQRGLFGD